MTISKLNIEEQLDKEINSLFKESKGWNFDKNRKKRVTYQEFLSNKMLIISAIRAGIPYSLFNLTQLYTPFTENDWANFLEISTKSLQRYKLSSKFNFKSLHSEKIIEMAEVTNAGLDVFEDMNKLKLWLNTPNFALGNQTPIELLKDSYGKELVLGELVRINHGILI